MSMRKQISHGSGSSTNSRRTQQTSKVRCKCGNDAVIRTVKNGPNCGSKFYGCPLWPVSLFIRSYFFFNFWLFGTKLF
ncbi:DNA topoisomerase 3-alpha [Bienertia sinuspersici]